MAQKTNKVACRAVLMAALLVFPIVPVSSQDQDQFFDSDGVPIHFIDVGEGDPVVLMHGLNNDLERAWIDTGIVEALADAGFRVLALDARAHGKSGAPHDPAKYGQEMALDIERLLDHVGIEKSHVIGYSMGSIILGKFRELRPERIVSLTLGGWGWRQDPGPTPTQLELAESLEGGGGFLDFYRVLYPDWSDEDREARSRATLARIPDPIATAALLRGFNFGVAEESLRNNPVPTLAVIGDKDPRKVTVDALQGVMTNLRIVVIEGADHAEAYGRPEFIEHVIEFLAEHSGS